MHSACNGAWCKDMYTGICSYRFENKRKCHVERLYSIALTQYSITAACSSQQLTHMCQTRVSAHVYRGLWQGQPVTVQLLSSADGSTQGSQAAQRQWLHTVQQLNHPGLMPVLGVFLQPAAIVTPMTKVMGFATVCLGSGNCSRVDR